MDSIKRRAPKNGYDNKPKQKYRETVWKRLAMHCLPILEANENAKVLMMPSSEGIEIDVAMKYGIKREQIIAIDENPALLAHAKWKSKIPKSNRFGCKVSQIGKKIAKNEWVLAGANLDFCNNFGEEIINEVNCFLKESPKTPGFSFFVTMMKGRESSDAFLLMKKMGVPPVFKFRRTGIIFQLIDIENKHLISLDYEDLYVSSKTPMIYAQFTDRGEYVRAFSKIHGNNLFDLYKRILMISNIPRPTNTSHPFREFKKRQKEYLIATIHDYLRHERDVQIKEIESLMNQINLVLKDKFAEAITSTSHFYGNEGQKKCPSKKEIGMYRQFSINRSSKKEITQRRDSIKDSLLDCVNERKSNRLFCEWASNYDGGRYGYRGNFRISNEELIEWHNYKQINQF